jgi:hypothetical protein
MAVLLHRLRRRSRRERRLHDGLRRRTHHRRPFAIIGAIGVVGQLPNFNRFLKEHNVEFELHTAG